MIPNHLVLDLSFVLHVDSFYIDKLVLYVMLKAEKSADMTS